METLHIWLILTIETAVAGGITLLVPKITRRGLLFGVYVGDIHWQSEGARAITSRWYRAMTGAVIVSVALGIAQGILAPNTPLAGVGPLVIVLVATVANYLRAHLAARAFAVAGAPVLAAAFVADPPGLLTVPIVALSIAVLLGLAAVTDAWVHYADLPLRIPTHFGPRGVPDAWSQKSFVAAMTLPLMTLAMGVFLGVLSCVTARAKRALRQSDNGVSYAAQMRFRRAVSTFLSGVAVLAALLMAGLSYGAVRVALGEASALSLWALAAGGVLVTYAVVGSLILMLRFGQGGARLEKAAAQSPLTNGLADNRHWVLGAFYVNRDDPSLMVEKRFGFGYTLNFGNPKAIAILAIPLLVVLALAVSALFAK
jgi:uncharacterized membrane protein